MRLLFVADVFGAAGRRIAERKLPELRERLDLDLVIVNGENAADGAGITSAQAKRLLAAGADVITLGNHAHRQREVYPYLDSESRIIRPANMSASAPGRGETVVTARDGTPVAVVNLLGRVFMDPATSPFELAPGAVRSLRERAQLVVVDFHAEATSEKVAMGRLLDGLATAVIGTHTHVQTSDAVVLPGGTAYITDAGMTGPHDSVIGVRTELILRRFTTGMPVRFEPAEGGVRLEGALIEADATGRATSISAVRMSEDS